MSAQINNIRPEFDREIVDIVDYVMNYEISSKVAYDTAHYCLASTRSAAVLKLSNTRPVKNCWGQLSPALSYPTACASPELSSSSTPSRRHLTSAR